MKWTGKIVGLLLGLMFGSPLTVFFGFLLGHLYDAGAFARWFGLPPRENHHARTQEVFFDSTFSIMGHMAKCDGRVSENEIRIAQHIMQEMNLSAPMKREAMRLFNEGKQPHFDLNTTLQHLRTACWGHPSLLKMFLEIQLKVAFADGQVLSPQKQEALNYIGQHLGLAGFNFFQFKEQYRAEQNYREYRYQTRHADPRAHLSDAYQLLGVSASTSDADVKKAYRRLMSQHHPDKLMAKGLPPEMIKMANQKTQQIKQAYEQICAARQVNA